MSGKVIDFYDVAKKRHVKISSANTKVVSKKFRNRMGKMMIGRTNDGRNLYKIVG